MYSIGASRWQGICEIGQDDPEEYEYTIEAWVNIGETWRQDIHERCMLAPDEIDDIRSDVLLVIELLGRMIKEYGLDGEEAASKEPLYGSILQSIKRNRPSEIDYINGEYVRVAKNKRLQAPLNERLVEMVRLVERTGKFFSKHHLIAETKKFIKAP
jgi:hypothetical protein